ncbi:MAG: cupin domain-containing protein [Gemmatimonadota bacterium]
MRTTTLLSILLVGSASTLMAQAPADMKWGPAPPFFPAGSRFTVLQGDPSKDGIYTVRLEMPAGYFIPPHSHPTDELVTIISGNLELGMGDAVDPAKAMELPAGGFVVAPANAHHYARAKTATVVQVHGMGPFAITYVNPKDDPRRP